MKVVVIFDILEEYREVRNELREFLKDMGGEFLQYSVYVADLDKSEVRILLKGIEKILRKGGGRIDIIFPCKRCFSNIKTVDTYRI
ncbi:MAG: CRISPR-associated endonuclease Cas2 [Thermoprotei archaeon]|nr:MAG: CRISPR-associated endonuclease Cas2 [Thermoprotei archaeon]